MSRPVACCFCTVSYNPLLHAEPFAAATPQQLSDAEEELGYQHRSHFVCPAHANGIHHRRPSLHKRKSGSLSSLMSDIEDDADAKRLAIDSHFVTGASTAAAPSSSASSVAAAASSSVPAAAAAAASSVSTSPVDISDPAVYSALCRAAHVPLDSPLAADLLQARCMDTRVSFASPDEYTARILQLMRDDDALLFRGHPNFTQKEGLPVIRQDTQQSHFRSNMANNSLHVMARLSTLKEKDLKRCTNMRFQRTYNLLCELPLEQQLAGHALWWTQSVADGAPLHADFLDNEQSCLFGRKAWVTVKYEEAKAAGIDIVDVRDTTPKYSWKQFLKCPSFRWFILAEGDTLFLPSNRLHGTHALGNTLTCGVGHYLAHLPSLPHILQYWASFPEIRPTAAEIKAIVDCWLPHIETADSTMRDAIKQARTASRCDSCRFSQGSPLFKLQTALKKI